MWYNVSFNLLEKFLLYFVFLCPNLPQNGEIVMCLTNRYCSKGTDISFNALNIVVETPPSLSTEILPQSTAKVE